MKMFSVRSTCKNKALATKPDPDLIYKKRTDSQKLSHPHRHPHTINSVGRETKLIWDQISEEQKLDVKEAGSKSKLRLETGMMGCSCHLSILKA